MTNIKMQYKWLPTAPGVCSRCVCVKKKKKESVLILIRIFIIVSLLKYSKYTV